MTQGDTFTSLLPRSFAGDPSRQREQQVACRSPRRLSCSSPGPRRLQGAVGAHVARWAGSGCGPARLPQLYARPHNHGPGRGVRGRGLWHGADPPLTAGLGAAPRPFPASPRRLHNGRLPVQPRLLAETGAAAVAPTSSTPAGHGSAKARRGPSSRSRRDRASCHGPAQ